MTEDTADMMIAYVYDELDDAQRSAFEKTLQADAALRAEVDGLLASRTFLEQDLKNDALLNVEPPAHLLNSILSAEPLAQVRQEVALPVAVKPPFTQRLSTWIFGGGIAISVAAAFVLLNTNVAQSEMAAVQAAPEGDMAEVANVAPRPENPEPAEDAKKMKSTDSVRDGYGASRKAIPAKAEKRRGTVAAKDLRGPARLDQNFLGDALKAEPKGSSGGAGSATGSEAKPVKKSEKRRAQSKSEISAKRAAKPLEAPSDRKFDFAAKEVSGSLGGRGGEAQKDAPPSPPARAPKVDGAPVHQGALHIADDRAEADADDIAMQNEPVANDKELNRESKRRESELEMAEEAAAPMAEAPSLDDEKTYAPKTTMSSKQMRKRAAQIASQNAKKKPKAKRSKRVQESLKNERDMRMANKAQLSFVAADSELSKGRYREAYDLYVLAGVQDKNRALGLAPTWGKMRALKALKRCKGALKLLPPFERSKPGAKDPAINEGLYVGALCAEETGDIARAKRLYRRLSRDRKIEKAMRQRAKAAYDRLNSKPPAMRMMESATTSEKE